MIPTEHTPRDQLKLFRNMYCQTIIPTSPHCDPSPMSLVDRRWVHNNITKWGDVLKFSEVGENKWKVICVKTSFSRPSFRWFQKKLSRLPLVSPLPCLYLFCSLTFCVWQDPQNTYNPGCQLWLHYNLSTPLIKLALGTDWSHSFMFVYSTDIYVSLLYAESWAHVWGIQDQIQFMALWCWLI